MKFVFMRPRLLRLFGRLIFIYQMCGLQRLLSRARLTALLPRNLQELEPLMPTLKRHFSDALICKAEMPPERRYRVGLLTGCVQDLIYSNVNRDTVDVLLAHSCEVITPRLQSCCGSLHAHNGELELAREMARRNILAMERIAGSLDRLNAIVSNAGGCGLHLKNYGHLLHDDPIFAARAAIWSRKLKDIHEWLAEIRICHLRGSSQAHRVTYHESCHFYHGQNVVCAPREVLQALPGVELVELTESNWCCGSAGVYNLTQPDMAGKLLDRKLTNIERTDAITVASANPGCSVQLEAGLRRIGSSLRVVHPVSLLAEALRKAGKADA